jgi:hypothetical protein
MVLVDLPDTPKVPVTVRIFPADAIGRAIVEVMQAAGERIPVNPETQTEEGLFFSLPAGYYNVKITFTPSESGHVEEPVTFLTFLSPPEGVWVVEARPEDAKPL